MNPKPFAALNHFTVPVSFMFPLLHLTMVFSRSGNAAVACVPGPDTLRPLDRGPIGDHKSHLTIQGLGARIQVGGVHCTPICAPPGTPNRPQVTADEALGAFVK